MIRNNLALAALVAVVAVGVATSGVALADGAGLARGDRASAFDVQDITGPNKGKQLCYV